MAETIPSTPNFVNSRFYLRNNTEIFLSQLSGQVQRRVLSGSYWMAEYTLPPMARENWAEWQAFFNKLEGRRNTFNGFDPDAKTARGVATGTPLVNGASQTGSSIITDGWTPSQTGILKAGDHISFGGELKQVDSDVNSDGSGNATITFTPDIRTSPSDNAAITVSDTTVEMILMSNDINFQIDPTGNSLPLTFTAMEVIA